MDNRCSGCEPQKGSLAQIPLVVYEATEHNIDNLQKLCVEISEFCRAVYASTASTDEREIFTKMIDKLRKI